MKKTLLINSKDRQSGTTSNFVYRIDGFLDNIIGIVVEDIQLFNTKYTIDSNNNKLYWTDNGANDIISTIPSQSYTLNELVIQIANLLNNDAVSGTYLCNYNLSTYKVSFSSSTGNLKLRFATTTNSVAYTIGFSETDTTTAASHTGSNIPNLNTKYYEIFSDIVDDNTYNFYGNRKTLAVIRNNKNFGELLDNNLYIGNQLKVSTSSLDKIRFIVYDDNNKEVELNGVDWSIQLTLLMN